MGSIPAVVRHSGKLFEPARCGYKPYKLRLTSQISFSPEYTTPEHIKVVLYPKFTILENTKTRSLHCSLQHGKNGILQKSSLIYTSQGKTMILQIKYSKTLRSVFLNTFSGAYKNSPELNTELIRLKFLMFIHHCMTKHD